MAAKAVFIPIMSMHPGPTLYDLKIDGRIAEYDVEPEDFSQALRRARHTGEVYIEDESGYRTRLTPRR